MKVQLLKGEKKETFGKGDNSFDYWHRPLTVEEKQKVYSHIIYKTGKNKYTVDTEKTDLMELLRLAVTKIDRLYDSDDGKVETIDQLLDLTLSPGELTGICVSMWVTIYIDTVLPEELKKKLYPDSTPIAKE